MKPDKAAIVLRSPQGVTWVKDYNQVIVIDNLRQEQHLLRDVEALVWGWLVSGYSHARTIRLLENLLALSPAEAEKNLHSMLDAWRQAGILELEAGSNG